MMMCYLPLNRLCDKHEYFYITNIQYISFRSNFLDETS